MKKTLSILIIFSIIFMQGCFLEGGGLHSNVLSNSDSAKVTVNVQMEREYVRNISGLGAGAVAMYLIVGPFSRNVIMLYGSARQDGSTGMRTVGTFEKQLNWGTNRFTVNVQKNSEVFLKLRAGGTRSGLGDVGSFKVGSEDRQMVTVKLLASGAEIF